MFSIRRGVRGLLVIGAGVAMAACGGADGTQVSSGPQVAAAARRSFDVVAEAAGQLEPILLVEVKSKASGEVLRLEVETGDRVERGDLLATIDPRDVRNSYEQARADLAVAEARLETSKAQLERIRQLREANVATDQEYETARLDEANSSAQLIKAQTALQLAEERLTDVTISAPLTGTIISKTVEVGTIIASASQNVSGGTTLFTMADLSEMQVRSLIDETDLGRIGAGMPAEVSVEAFPDRRFRGTVLKIEPQAIVDQNVTMFPVLIRLDNREGLLRPGMNADVQIQIARREDVLTVPNAAVVSVQSAPAAGAVLGLDESEVRQALMGGPAREEGPVIAMADSTDRPAAAGAEAAAPAQDGAVDCRALFARVRSAGGSANLSQADRDALEACRAQAGRQSGGQQRVNGDTRPGVVFVSTASGIEPRSVVLGLNDWDNTEVISGLEEGEQVVIVSVAQLQQQQEEFMNRMRERMGGPVPGSGGR